MRESSDAFREVLDEQFPGSLPEPEFVDRTNRALSRHGFTADNTLAWVATCRDELSGSLAAAVAAAWGPAFSFTSLAGMPTAGRSGFAAAAAHLPLVDGKQRLVFYGSPHIGVSGTGAIGEVERPAMATPSQACGALAALLEEIQLGSGGVELDPQDLDPQDLDPQDLDPQDLDPQDLELSHMRRRLLPMLDGEHPPDLVQLTKLALEAIVADTMRVFDSLLEEAYALGQLPPTDIGFVAGIQIHGPDGGNFFWPSSAEVYVDGVASPLS